MAPTVISGECLVSFSKVCVHLINSFFILASIYFFLFCKTFRGGNEVILACWYPLSERKCVPVETLMGDLLGLGNKGHPAIITEVIRKPLSWPKAGKEGLTSRRPARKELSPFFKDCCNNGFISPLNGSCLFIQHYCLTDTHSTWRLGNWSQTVWGRDEICALVKVLLKHKTDIIPLFRHHTVTYFDSLSLKTGQALREVHVLGKVKTFLKNLQTLQARSSS